MTITLFRATFYQAFPVKLVSCFCFFPLEESQVIPLGSDPPRDKHNVISQNQPKEMSYSNYAVLF